MIVAMFSSPIRWVIMFAPLIFVFAFSAAINRMSASTAQTVFWIFGAVMGLSVAWIFAVFTGISIAQTFFATAAGFGALSLWGYTTQKDLSGWGSFLLMGLVGLIVADGSAPGAAPPRRRRPARDAARRRRAHRRSEAARVHLHLRFHGRGPDPRPRGAAGPQLAVPIPQPRPARFVGVGRPVNPGAVSRS
jgi:hypothetical protein